MTTQPKISPKFKKLYPVAARKAEQMGFGVFWHDKAFWLNRGVDEQITGFDYLNGKKLTEEEKQEYPMIRLKEIENAKGVLANTTIHDRFYNALNGAKELTLRNGYFCIWSNHGGDRATWFFGVKVSLIITLVAIYSPQEKIEVVGKNKDECLLKAEQSWVTKQGGVTVTEQGECE
jgi:hypothetical protein